MAQEQETSMLEDVKAFNEALATAEQTYQETSAKISERRDSDEAYSYDTMLADRGAANEARFNAIEAAWNKLAESENKLVAYIGKNHHDHPHGELQIILDALPLDLNGLLKLAKEHDWCGDFNRGLNRAVAAGAVDGADGVSGARYMLRYHLISHLGLYTSDLDGIDLRVDDVIKAVLAEHGITEPKTEDEARLEPAGL